MAFTNAGAVKAVCISSSKGATKAATVQAVHRDAGRVENTPHSSPLAEEDASVRPGPR